MEHKEENWQSLHNTLLQDLQNEVRLTRELLSNMHQEEVSLMLHDMGSLNQVLIQRSNMLEKLSFLRSERHLTTQKIERIASVQNPHPSLDHILPPHEETSAEILSLSDQLFALTERLNRQHSHNQRLGEHPEHHRYAPIPAAQEQRAKRKASVATYNLKR